MQRIAPGAALLIAASYAAGCRTGGGANEPPIVPLTEPSRLCNEPNTEACRDADEVASWLRSRHLSIVQATRAAGGIQGVQVLTLKEDSDPENPVYFRAKWRRGAGPGPDWINDPRRELVAYATQQLFLEPDEYVVPPTSGYCFPLETYRAFIDPRAEPSWPDVPCVHGYLTFWLTDAGFVGEEPDKGKDDASADGGQESTQGSKQLLSKRRFDQDDLYANKIARLNVLALAVSHGDAHRGQFLVTQDPFAVYSIDHSVSLTSIKNPLVIFHEDWSKWRMPGMPAALAGRLLALERSDVESLAVLERYRRVGSRLVPVWRGPSAKASRPREVDESLNFDVRMHEGELQVGSILKEREIIWANLSQVAERLRSGEIPIRAGRTAVGLVRR